MPGEREYQLPTDPQALQAMRDQQQQYQAYRSAVDAGARTGQDETGRSYYIAEGSDNPTYFDSTWVAQDPSRIGRAGGYQGDYDGRYYWQDPRYGWTQNSNGADRPAGNLITRIDEKDTGLFGGLAPYLGMAASAFGLPSYLGGLISGGAPAGSMMSMLGNAAGSGLVSGATSAIGGGSFGRGFLGGAAGNLIPAATGSALQGSGLPDFAVRGIGSTLGGAARAAIGGRDAGRGALSGLLGSLGGSAGRELVNQSGTTNPGLAMLIGQLPGLLGRATQQQPSGRRPTSGLPMSQRNAILAEARRRGLVSAN